MPKSGVCNLLFCVMLVKDYAVTDGDCYACGYDCGIFGCRVFAYHAIHVFHDLDKFTCHLCLNDLFEVRSIEECPECQQAYQESGEQPGPEDPIIIEEAVEVESSEDDSSPE